MRESQTKKIPITLILGDKEVESKTISYRLFGFNETKTVSIDEFEKMVNNTIKNKEYNIK